MTVIAMMPASVMTIATTKASRGRSIKMPENISVPRHHHRRHDLAGPHLLYALDDDQFSFLEPVGDHNFAALLGPGRHAAQLDFLRLVHEQHIAAGLV